MATNSTKPVYAEVFSNKTGDTAKDVLPKDVLKHWSKYIEVRDTIKEPKKAFEDAFIAVARKSGELKPDETLQFGYNFGKLAVAKVPMTKKATTTRFKLG